VWGNLPQSGPLRPYLDEHNMWEGSRTQVVVNKLIIAAQTWQRVLEVVQEFMPLLDAGRNVPTALHRLGKYTALNSQDIEECKASPAFSALLYRFPPEQFEHRGLANCVWSLARLDVDDALLLQQFSRAATEKMENSPQDFNLMEISNIVWAFANIQNNGGPPMPPSLANSVVQHLIKRDISEGTTQFMSNVLWGLAIAEYNGDLKTQLLQKITDQMKRTIDLYKGQDLANSIYALSVFGFCDTVLLEKLAPQACKSLRFMRPQELCQIVHAYSVLDVYHAPLAEAVDYALANPAEYPKLRKNLTKQGVVTILKSFAQWRFFPIHSMPMLVQGLGHYVEELNSQEISNSLWSFARFGYHPGRLLSQLSREAKKRTKEFASIGLGLSIWALAVLRETDSSVFRALVEGSVQAYHAGRFDIIQDDGFLLGAYFQALLTAQMEALHGEKPDPLKDIEIPLDLHAKAVAFWKEQIADFNVSRFQEEVSQAFHELNWEHHMEYEADQLYSLDLMLESKSQKIAIEADGPMHFTVNTQQPIGPFLLRRRALRLLGWIVVSVPYFKWHYIKEKDRAAFLLTTLINAGVDLPEDIMIPEGFDPSKPGVQMVVPRSTRGGISKRPASAIADEGLVNSRMRRGVTLTRHRDLNNIELEASQSRPWGSDRSPAASQAQPSSGAQSALVDSGGAADMLERQQRMQDLSTLKVEKDLKPLLRKYGLPIYGAKRVLIERILEHELP